MLWEPAAPQNTPTPRLKQSNEVIRSSGTLGEANSTFTVETDRFAQRTLSRPATTHATSPGKRAGGDDAADLERGNQSRHRSPTPWLNRLILLRWLRWRWGCRLVVEGSRVSTLDHFLSRCWRLARRRLWVVFRHVNPFTLVALAGKRAQL